MLPRLPCLTCLAVVLLLTLVAPAARAAPAGGRPVVTVLYFDNDTGDGGLDVLRKGLADMIITDLVAWDGVTVVEREKLESVMGELKLQRTRSFDEKTAVAIGKFVGAEYLLMGTIHSAAPELRLDARLVAAKDATLLTSATVRGPRDKVFALEQDLVLQLTAKLDLRLTNQAARRRAQAPDLDALIAYSKALDLSDQGQVAEAKKAIQELVTRSPSFLMAREKKAQILKRLEEQQARRVELVTGSVVEVGRRADAALKDPTAFDALDEAGQAARLGWRVVRGRVLARLLKQELSSRAGHLRVVLLGHEPGARKVVRAMIDNLRTLAVEEGAFRRLRRSGPGRALPPEVQNLVREAQLGEVAVGDPFDELARFVVEGRVIDGDKGFRMAPAPGDLDDKERQAVFDECEARIQKALAAHAQAGAADQQAAEHAATRELVRKAELLVDQGDDEKAIVEYQRILDAFPTGADGPRYEVAIKRLIGAADDHEHREREKWAKAMQDGCKDDMDVRVGLSTVLYDHLRRGGLAGLTALAAELEKACTPTPRNRSAFASVYSTLASAAATHEDCAAYRAFSRKYVENGGSVGDLQAGQKNRPWCDLGDVLKQVMWMHGQMDENWDFELDAHLVSIRSNDGKMLTLNGRHSSRNESIALRLDAAGGGGWTCREVDWHRRDGESWRGTCAVTLTHVAAAKGEYDEGTFTAQFTDPAAPRPRTVKLDGVSFRLRRE